MSGKPEIKTPTSDIIERIDNEIKLGNLISALFLVSSSLESLLSSNILLDIPDEKLQKKIEKRIEKSDANQLVLLNLVLQHIDVTMYENLMKFFDERNKYAHYLFGINLSDKTNIRELDEMIKSGKDMLLSIQETYSILLEKISTDYQNKDL
jgi:regulator of replication initiation timing